MADAEHASTGEPVAATSNGAADAEQQLKELSSKALSLYAVKDYEAAATEYAHASELQAEVNGEMSPKNAALLFAYGRCLYQVALKNSDVLGSKVVGEEKKPKEKAVGNSKAEASTSAGEGPSQPNGANGVNRDTGDENAEKKPLFQFTGDENWDSASEGGSDAEDGGLEQGDEEPEDDFANAFEVLDMARVLFLHQIEEINNSSDPATAREKHRKVEEQLSDTYDLQAEISLEGEKFSSAVLDLKDALKLKLGLYPTDSSLIAEAHYKLSLALEFAAVTPQAENGQEAGESKEVQVDNALRAEAAQEMQAAIDSCRKRVERETARLQDDAESGVAAKEKTKADIADVKGMIKEMELRLVDLRQPVVSVQESQNPFGANRAGSLADLLGSQGGASAAMLKEKLEAAMSGANDLSSLVKKKKPTANAPVASEAAQGSSSGTKRKLDDAEGETSTAKTPKTDD